jgi:hypothetical protein
VTNLTIIIEGGVDSLRMHQRIAVKNFGCIFNFVFGMLLYAKKAGFFLNF